MTESPFKLRHPTDYHLQQQQHQYYHHQQQQQQQQVLMEDYPQQGGFLSPLLSDFDELDVKHNNRVIDMDIMSEESPSDYSSVLSNSHPPQSFLMDFHQKYNSADTLLSVSPQSPTLFNGPFSAPSQMGYLAALNQNTSMEDFESLQLQQQILTEKKRRRRESHNAVERRRRENINERIQELGTLLPDYMYEEITTHIGNNNKPNKGAILRKSVDHIKLLQQQVSNYKQRIQELESQLTTLTQPC
ncbi:hypothetical protein G6F70_002443 [Rhizopus microsporus]|uniref:Helix-loop-helix DNA-binding protein n=1 Tax=Rhizopus microsporus TaxID=58291 RepID=A0A1X0S2A8_RHIZD|nr:hypothetical protein G6F71_001137 [Rhizopus microsporus]KAG1202241.1 hypothetical protein G6F70_002443 [Rhizopus microsporus]KAG1213964.1 hypothetical protein G6F69_002359 [Rhizopus microsporus]KAG1236235.1 hypothetical protein G6F67_002152 [Rhizopus microsporus]KAG1268194.1 hypothetical protein G6F68_001318 [Rhizopus microsporus]